MPKQRGAKPKGRGKDSDYRRGYQNGWRRVENQAKGVKPRQSEKGRIQISKQSKEYQRGFEAGVVAAKECYIG